MSDEWSDIANWFKTLTNQTNIKLLMTLSDIQNAKASVDAPIYDVVTLASEIRETRQKTEDICRILLERGLVHSPNHGYIKGQNGFRKKKNTLPEIQLSSEGIIASNMIQSLRNQDNFELKKEDYAQINFLQFLNKIEQPLKDLHNLVEKSKEELGQS